MARTIHRTAVFTIHKPTRHIRAVLDEALEDYTKAYTAILDFYKDYTPEELHAMSVYGKKDNGELLNNARTLETALFRRNKIPGIDQLFERLEARLRASLKNDAASTLLSYAELSMMEKHKPSYPNRIEEQDRDKKRIEALSMLATITDDLDEENFYRDQLLRTRQRGLVPLSFGNSMPDQGFRIFYNPETKTFYARLYVIGALSKHKRKITLAGRYIDIREPENTYMRHEDAAVYTNEKSPKYDEYIHDFGTGTRSIIVPLEMGRWHEEQLRFTEYGFLPQRGNDEVKPAWPVSAKLIKKDDSYQLHVAFQIPKPDRVKAETYLGINRSMDYLACGAVLSLDGTEIKDTFNVSTKELHSLIGAIEKNIAIKQKRGKSTKGDSRRATIAKGHVHACANEIVQKALMHRSQVVIEDLSYLSPQSSRKRFGKGRIWNRILQRRQYQKMQDILTTKLELAGLPPLRKVSTSGTASTCTQCGCMSKENFVKEERSLFRCSECGYETNVDKQACVSIARKPIFITLRSKEKQKEIPEGQGTTWEMFARSFKK